MKEMQIKEKFDKNDTLVVKGIAILLMLFYHLFESRELLETLQVNHAPFSQETFLTLSGYGNICVAVFVFLSAYGITRGLMQERELTPARMMEGAAKRCARLMGNFAVMYLSINLLWFRYFNYAGLYGKGWQGGMLGIVDMLGLAQFFGTPTMNMTWWYMAVAILIIFGTPFLYLLTKKIGNYVLILAVLLPLAVSLDEGVERYLVTAALGAAAAQEGWFERLFSWKRNRLWKGLLGLGLIAVSVLIRQNYMVHTYFLWIVDAPVALLLCWFGGEIAGRIPVIRQVLAFFGRHSMNIFLVHTFFYLAIYRDFIYSFRQAGLIFFVLAAVTLVYSVVLELLKTGGRALGRKALHFRKGEDTDRQSPGKGKE